MRISFLLFLPRSFYSCTASKQLQSDFEAKELIYSVVVSHSIDMPMFGLILPVDIIHPSDGSHQMGTKLTTQFSDNSVLYFIFRMGLAIEPSLKEKKKE